MTTNRFLRGLNDGEHAEISKLSTVYRFQSGERLMAQGSANDRLFMLDEGIVRMYRGRADAQRQFVIQLEPGAFFGELSVLDGQPAAYDAIAATGGSLRSIGQTDLLRLLAADGQLAARLLRNLLGVVLERARDNDERLSLYAGNVSMLRRYNNN